MYDLAILTTAIIRPKIHSYALNSIKNIINKEFSIYWIINIDFVNTLPTLVKNDTLKDAYKIECLDYTEKNIRKLFAGYNITFKFIKNIQGDFNNAVRNLISETKLIYNSIQNAILYLEDDWVITKYYKKYSIQYHFDFLNTTFNCLGISFINNPRIGFKPTLWNKKYFKEIFMDTFDNISKTNIDPEELVRDYNKYGYKVPDLLANNVFIKPSEIVKFQDIGIAWRNRRKLKKWGWNNDITTYH